MVTLSAVTVAALYLSNQVLPATYGSRPNGDDWVSAIKTGGYIWACLAAYAFIRLTILFIPTRIKSWLNEYASVRLTYVADASRILFLQLYMLIILMLKEPPRSRYSACYAITPLTHINYNLTF
jgi:hypothetical protein